MIATFFSGDDGRPLRRIEGSRNSVELQLENGEAWVEGDWFETHFLNLETGRPNKLKQMKPGASANRLVRVPAGTLVTGDGFAPRTADGGAILFETPYPETLRVTLDHPQYRTVTIDVPCDAVESAGDGIAVEQDYAALRRVAYLQRGITPEALVIAMAEADDGRPEELEQMLAQRREVKTMFPKPVPDPSAGPGRAE